jgi:GntR family transcriptional regulator, transcriptional repressor for pyruvate dehydrogenase complex
LTQHRQIADAIRLGDAPRAAASMSDHLKTVRAVKLLSWSPD